METPPAIDFQKNNFAALSVGDILQYYLLPAAFRNEFSVSLYLKMDFFKEINGSFMKLLIPLKDIMLAPGKRFDPASCSENDIIERVNTDLRWYFRCNGNRNINGRHG